MNVIIAQKIVKHALTSKNANYAQKDLKLQAINVK